MTFRKVGDLLEQKVYCDFKPSSSSGAQREGCELGFHRGRENGFVIMGFLFDGLVTYSSTPELSPG